MNEKKVQINDKIKRLDDLVKYFETSAQGELNIEQDLVKYEEALKLVNEIKKELEDVELRINVIKEKYQ